MTFKWGKSKGKSRYQNRPIYKGHNEEKKTWSVNDKKGTNEDGTVKGTTGRKYTQKKKEGKEWNKIYKKKSQGRLQDKSNKTETRVYL